MFDGPFDDLIDFLKFVGVILGVTTIFVIPFIALGLWTDSKACYNKWEDSGYTSRWSVWTDCQILVDGKWIPTKNFYYKKDVN